MLYVLISLISSVNLSFQTKVSDKVNHTVFIIIVLSVFYLAENNITYIQTICLLDDLLIIWAKQLATECPMVYSLECSRTFGLLVPVISDVIT